MIALLTVALPLAWAGDERDDDIFGSTDAPAEAPVAAPSAPPPAAGPEASALDGTAPSDASILGRLAEVDDRLAIGGQLYMPISASFAEGTPAGEGTLSNPNLLDLYADVRPNDRLRAYVRGRFKYDFTIGSGAVDYLGEPVSPSSVALDQLWLKWDIGRRVYVTLGRQRVKWGAGRFWNPTDFMNQQVLDPLAAYDLRTGVTLLKVHVPLESLGGNLYGLASFDGATTPAYVGGALRAEWLIGNTEISASASARKDQPLRLGADLSTAIWVFDLHAEGAVQHGVTASYYTGALDLETLTFPTEVDRSDEWIPQVVAGIEVPIRYSDEDSLTVGVEGFYDGFGYDDSSLYPWLLFNGAYTPFYLGKQYLGAYVYAANPGKLRDQSFTASYLSNLSDGSMIARADWRATVYRKLAFNTYVAGHFGDPGEFKLSFDIPAVKGVPGLETGLSVPPPLVDVGIGLNVPF